MDNPFIYVLLNGELNMSAGKASAQAVHAVTALHAQSGGLDAFSEYVKRTVIVLEAKDQQQMINLENYLYHLGIPAAFYIDEGVNEVAPYSITALAVGPIYQQEESKREVLSMFPLFPKRKPAPKKRGFFR